MSQRMKAEERREQLLTLMTQLHQQAATQADGMKNAPALNLE